LVSLSSQCSLKQLLFFFSPSRHSFCRAACWLIEAEPTRAQSLSHGLKVQRNLVRSGLYPARTSSTSMLGCRLHTLITVHVLRYSPLMSPRFPKTAYLSISYGPQPASPSTRSNFLCSCGFTEVDSSTATPPLTTVAPLWPRASCAVPQSSTSTSTTVPDHLG
jgi:hypothetical protein